MLFLYVLIRNIILCDIPIIVNDVDVYGNKCSLPTYYSYPCPELCVRDISMCPPNNKPPTCPTGTAYCVDGQCRETCSPSLVSVCACPGSPALVGNVYSCGSSNLRPNIQNFVVSNKANQSAEACSKAANLQNVPNWSPNPQSAMWHECPTPDYGQFTYTEDVFIALYTFYGSCAFVLTIWILYKRSREKVYICNIKLYFI
jgi:hypothetical protein